MTPYYALKLLEIVQELSRAVTAASDPHIDCRDEMGTALERAEALAREMLDASREIPVSL